MGNKTLGVFGFEPITNYASGLNVARASLRDAYDIHEIINYFADAGEMLHRSIDEINQNINDFVVVKNKTGNLIATAALHKLDDKLGEIKGVAVKENWQGKGVGSILIQSCLQDALKLGINEIFVLTNKPEFYNKMGFSLSNVTKFPIKIWSECIGCSKFFSCNEIIMSIDIDPN
tara:strand:+ start:1698 stop:2222 length:525 start_codon:yes stop_codon:yes gene_type:complete